MLGEGSVKNELLINHSIKKAVLDPKMENMG